MVFGVAAAARRRPRLVLAMVCASATCAGLAAAGARATEGTDLARVVTATKACSFHGRVLEQAGGLGTLVALDPPFCSNGVIPSGTVVWDAARSPASGSHVQGR